MTTNIPFFLVSAFSTNPFAGNPAAVIFLDTSETSDVLGNLAKNLNQPMTAIVSPEPIAFPDETTVRYSIRWFAPSGEEVPLCGHATLATAHTIFIENKLSPAVNTLQFQIKSNQIVEAKRIGDGWQEIQFPAGSVTEVRHSEQGLLKTKIYEAFGRQVSINGIFAGGPGFEHYLLVELDEKENLASSTVNTAAFKGSGYKINIITTLSSSAQESFVSRMFAPEVLADGEDPVCGSAHCILGPYWSDKQGIPPGKKSLQLKLAADVGR
ncbi:hypothetical protein BDQ17DRAFT_1509935 [Cyathus striatus]|nr:hypothetical protein BDQ17DRAFT_1509935 [Cyathus striatus]